MKTLLELLTTQTLKPFVDKAHEIERLNEIWPTILKDEWALQCKVANFENGLLTLSVPHAALATRIRYLIPDLTKELQANENFKTLKKIQCKVIYLPTAHSESAKSSFCFSPATKMILEKTAKSISNQNLKNSLLNLAKSFNQDENEDEPHS